MNVYKPFERGDLIGDNIIFLSLTGKTKRGDKTALFRCHCGNEFEAMVKKVKGFEKKNCGCGIIKRIDRKLSHKETSEYNSWNGMKDRCNNPNSKDYHRYGAKGITVCDAWNNPETGFQAFLNDMGPKPSSKHTIDRKDGTKSYSPENCRWATYIEQNRNLSSNRQLTYKGKTMLRIEWVELLGINESTFDNYLIRHGNDMEAIISEMKSKGLQLNYP